MASNTLLGVQWRDATNDPALGKMYIDDAATDGDIEDLLDELQGLSDISIKASNKIVLTAFANSVPATAKGAGHEHADDKDRIQFIYSTDNPAEYVRVSVYGPLMSCPIGNDNIVDPSNAAYTDLHTQVIKSVRSNSGAVPVAAVSGKFITG